MTVPDLRINLRKKGNLFSFLCQVGANKQFIFSEQVLHLYSHRAFALLLLAFTKYLQVPVTLTVVRYCKLYPRLEAGSLKKQEIYFSFLWGMCITNEQILFSQQIYIDFPIVHAPYSCWPSPRSSSACDTNC